MNTFIFQSGMTWRKAGYSFFSDSTSYREVINANPVWDITSTPPPGSGLYQPGYSGSGSASFPALSSPIGGETFVNSDSKYYPFLSEQEYVESLIKYSPSALMDVERYNGWTMSSDKPRMG